MRSLFSYSSFHFLDDGLTDSVYLLIPFIASELDLSFSQVGLITGVSYFIALFQLPLSLLGERVGELTVIFGGTLGLAGGFLVLSMSYTFAGILFSLIIARGTGSGQHGLGSAILSRAYEVSGRRMAMGTYNFSGDLGKVCIPFLAAVLISFWGWREAVFLLSAGGLAAGAILWGIARNEGTLPQREKPGGEAGTAVRLSQLLVRTDFLALLTIGVIDIAARLALLTFLPFLLLQKGFQGAQVSFALTLVFAGGAVGKLVCGICAERFGIIPMVIGTEVVTAAGIITLAFSPSSAMLILLPFIGVVLNGTSSVLYATVADIIPPKAIARAYGLYYTVTLGLGAISPVFFGFLAEWLSLSWAIILTASMLLLTIPLSRYLIIKTYP
jgi:MFS family permease